MGTLRTTKKTMVLTLWKSGMDKSAFTTSMGRSSSKTQSVSRTSWMGLCEQNTVAHGQMLMNQLPGKMFPHDGSFRNEQCAARGYTVQVANPVIAGVHVTQGSWFAKPSFQM